MANSKTVLCVEDDADSCELLQYILEGEGFQVVSCSEAEEGSGEPKKVSLRRLFWIIVCRL